MDKINGINHIIELFQARLSNSARKEKAKGRQSTTNFSSASTSSTSSLKKRIAKRLEGLDKDSKNYKGEAFDIFIDEVLSWGFGDDITTDPDFKKLKEKVSESFINNDALNKEFEKILL